MNPIDRKALTTNAYCEYYNRHALTSKLLEKRIAIVKINILNRKEGTWKQFVFVRQNNWNKLLATKILVDPLKKFNI